MTRREKHLQRLRQNPNDVSFEEIRQVLESEGFELDHITGSHHIFRVMLERETLTLVMPFARPVKPVYVRKAIAAIDKLRQATQGDEVDDEYNAD